MYLTYGHIVWRFRNVWCLVDDLNVDEACYVSSISTFHSTRQRHIWNKQRMHQDTAVVYLLMGSQERLLHVSEDGQSSEVNSWQSALML